MGSLLTVLLLVLTGIGVAAGRAAAVPPYTLEERALAVASPSMVYLETVYTGYLRDRQTNQALFASPITYNRRCSGFVVSPDGYVVSTRICVQPPDETVRQQALYLAAWSLLGDRKLDAGQVDAYVASHMNTTAFTGIVENTGPDIQLFGQLNIATAAVAGRPAISGKVVKVNDPNDGNVAVVKLDQRNLPAAEIQNASTLALGTSILTLGFNTTDADPHTGTYTVESKQVQVVGEGKRGVATFYKISEALGVYSHGGLAIDLNGRVVGMVDEDLSQPSNANNRAVAQTPSITALLSAAGVSNSLGDSDKLYRRGLDAYFSGRYNTAISQLGTVAKNAPTNQMAKLYRQRATDREKIEGDPSSSTPGWVIGVVAGAGGAMIAALIVVLIMARGRARRREIDAPAFGPSAPYQFAPMSGAPMSGAPISGAPMSGAPTSGVPVSPAVPPPFADQPVPPYQPTVYDPTAYEPQVYRPAPHEPPPVSYQAAPHQAAPYQAAPQAAPYQAWQPQPVITTEQPAPPEPAAESDNGGAAAQAPPESPAVDYPPGPGPTAPASMPDESSWPSDYTLPANDDDRTGSRPGDPWATPPPTR